MVVLFFDPLSKLFLFLFWSKSSFLFLCFRLNFSMFVLHLCTKEAILLFPALFRRSSVSSPSNLYFFKGLNLTLSSAALLYWIAANPCPSVSKRVSDFSNDICLISISLWINSSEYVVLSLATIESSISKLEWFPSEFSSAESTFVLSSPSEPMLI